VNRQELYLKLILNTLHERHGVDFSLYRETTLERRLARRMAATRSDSYEAYFSILEKHPEEYGHLARDLAIKVSRFFRNQHLFDLLSNDLCPCILNEKEARGDKSLRIWCAGCAFGEEVYSVAITLVECLQRMRKKVEDYNVSIFGTDIDGPALVRAGLGEYEVCAFREARQEIIDKYFILSEQTGSESPEGPSRKTPAYRVVDTIRRLVHFSVHDLTSETRKSPPAGVVANYDMILCRNVLIYFSKSLQKRAFSNLLSSLNRGGYLILGRAESIPEALESVLIPHSSSKKVYRKSLKSPL
jgi:chemotaxis methyl-accepting protein methylase